MRKGDIEKSLKRFLKRKVSYSLALLIAFMITGGISLGAEITAEEIQESKGDLLSRIQTEREEIKRKIAENERLIKEYNSNFVELVRKGDFYSKPLFNSTQVFFSYQHLDSGKMKDVTEKEFSETIDAINKHYGTRSGRSILKSTGNIGKDKLMAGNGVAVDTEVFRETIEVGANIKPVEPVLPEINPSVSVNVSAPTITLGGLPSTVAPVVDGGGTITAPSLGTITAPSGVTVSVATPGAVGKIEVTKPEVTTPATPPEKNIIVGTPIGPEGYEPTMIIPPVTPSKPEINIPTIPTIDVAARTTGTGDNAWFWNSSGDLGPISQINIDTGTFNVTSSTNINNISISNYTGTAAFQTGTAGYTAANNPITATATSTVGFYKWVSASVVRMGTGVTINFHGDGTGLSRGLIKNDIHGDIATTNFTLDNLLNRSYTTTDYSGNSVSKVVLTQSEYDFIKNKIYLYHSANNSASTTFVKYAKNEATWNLSGSKVNGYEGDGHEYYAGTTIFHNAGNITAMKDSSIIALTGYGPESGSYNNTLSSVNTGTMTLNGTKATMFVPMRTAMRHEINFINYGNLVINGGGNVGAMLKGYLKNTSSLILDKPIEIYGDGNIGVSIQSNDADLNNNSIVKVNIGVNQAGSTNISEAPSDKASGNTNDGIIKANVGLYSIDTNTTIGQHNILIGEQTNQNIGVAANAGTLTIGTGEIKIYGGRENVGLFTNGGNIASTGNISIEGGENNRIAIARNGKTITIGGTVSVGNISGNKAINNTIPFYVTDTGSKITLANDTLEINLSGDSIGVYSTTSGEFTANRSSLIHSGTGFGGGIIEPTAPVNIYVKGTTVSGLVKGVGLFADNGGKINTKNTYVKVKDGSVGIASIGNNSNVDITNGIVDYEGNGYAVYSDGVGTVDLTDGEIILRGKATALELDLSTPSSNPIILNRAKIVVMSNDAVGVNLKNIGALNIGTLKTDIETKLGGVNIVAGTDGNQVFDKYKIAAVDGGTLNINANMDKSDTDTSSTGFFYYRRFLGQRLNLNVLANIEVKSEINSSDAEANFKEQVVGLEMNSSKSAASATDAQINLAAGSKVIADRTDVGVGAIGLYMNFGKIDITAGAGVEVEKGANTVNDKAVGVYAVNGSKVDNAGNIEVKGNQSIGILGMAYREDDEGNILTNEFGTGGIFAEQGKVTITNTGNIALDGIGTIGIYANNNNTGRAAADNVVTNDTLGTIIVGDSDNSAAAIGIYGKKATIKNEGNITVGSGGVAIYATEGSNVTKLGTLKLGSDGIGVMLDGTSTIAATATTVTLESKENTVDINGKTGIFYKGSSTGSDSQDIDLDINASNFVKGTAIYVQDMDVTSSGSLTVGTEGIGIFVAKKAAGAAAGTNKGTIELGASEKAIGMYGKNTAIANETGNGIINVNHSSQIGMYADGDAGNITNTGAINLKVDGATGIYVKDKATADISGDNINFSTHNSSIGVYAEGANVNFTNTFTFQNDNANKNIYVYGKNSTVKIAGGETVTIDGGSIPTAAGTEGNKTVGIYLENAGAGSTFNGVGDLTVKNGAVGIYSKGNNDLTVKVKAEGDKTTGVFIDGESKIKGTVTATGSPTSGAIGVYGSGGAVSIGNDTGLTLNIGTVGTTNKGTGMYLTDGAYATGGKITVNNSSTGNNIGVYYSNGTASGPVTNGSEIELTGKNGVGIYAADGIILENSKNITSATSDNIASYVGGDSTLTSNGTITMSGANNIGIYAGKGTGRNAGTIDLTGASGTSVGMVAQAVAGETATIENATGKEIKVGANLGMYIAGTGTSKGINRGTITATTGTGVYIEDSGNSFDGTGGTIKSDKVGIYLKDTTAGTVTNTGTLEIASGGVGVFGENAQIDFEVDTSTSEGAIGVAASGTSVISGNIKTGQDSVGVYILDNDVTFAGADITTGNKNGGTSVGILFDSSKQGTYNVNNVTVNAKDGVGIYLQGSSGTTLNFGGTITIAGTGAVGIYVTTGTTLDSNNSSFNISNGAVGVYVTSGGTANLGTTGNLTFNFGTGGGTGVYNNGGTLTLGNNITVTGSGSLAATVNGDLTSSGNLTIGEGGTALLGKYDVGTIADKNITNTGNIKAESGGKGIAAIKGSSTPSGVITINNAGTITVSGKSSGGDSSIGIYTNIAEINSTGTVEVGTDGIGIYAADSGKAVKNDNMTMTGDNGIGVYIKGATGGLTANNITSTGGKGNTGLVLDGTTSSSLPLYINAGTITLGDESIGVMATGTASSTIDGSITVGDSSTGKSAIGIVAKNSNLNLTGITKITAGKGGIGIYAEGTSQVSNVDASKIIVGTDGIYMYSSVGTSISFTGNITADNQIGIVVGGSVSGAGATIIAKNGGIGAYVKGTGSSFTVTNIIVQSGIAETGTDPAKYSVGVYYEDAGNIGTLPTVAQTGSYTIGMVLDRTTGTTTTGINIGTSGSNQVGVIVKGGSILEVTAGGITAADGDSNIGIYGENSTIEVTGDISVGTASSLTNSSIGVSLKGGSYTGITGNLEVGNNSIGIYGTNMTGNIRQSGTTMTVGDNGVGIYGSGTGNIILSMTTIGLGNNNSIGVYAKGMNTDVTGNMSVGTNTSIGIVSEGTGDVKHTGAMTITGKGTGEKDTGSVGIYKLNGTGTITTTGGNNWTVGNNGYGIFVKQEAGQKATINNGANMTLGMSAVGIYSSGANTVNNSGTITVGETDTKGDPNNTKNHLNSVGIYVTNGTTVNNTGDINVEHDFSVGIYGSGIGTKITNVLGATISVDKGGVGILVQNGAVAENEGTITLGSTAGIYGATTVGMAAYSGASIINGSTGIINVGIGSGMIVGVGATLTNNGVINVTNGIGIEGAGHIINQGTIKVTGTGTDVGNTGVGSAEVGSIKIESNGDVIINDKYVGIGGTLTTAGAIEVNGAYVDVTTGVPLFNAQSVSGEVNILPNFALTGNGITYKIEGFVNTAMGTITGTKLTPVTSPLFIAKVTDKGDLVIAKRPYADLTIGEQFDALDKGLDNILANSGGIGKDAEILKGLNAYLEGLPDYQFEGEASRKLAETRGDIYSTIQGRMQDINRAFDNSFYELESSYNLTKDSSKYSVIYTDGDYKDPTLGIEDYDYKIMGLLYMKEKEGTEYGSKYGYTLGFTGSKFEFENDSKEDVYSLRAGVHRVKNLSEEHKVSWLSRIELGYNRHIAERKLNLHETFENKGEYNTYSVALDNRITKVIYTDLSRELDIYADLDLEYGKVDGFTESAGSNGGLEVQIKDNDYLSAQLGAGVKASQRIYAGNDVSVKVTADVKYAYELGDNYDGNKARLKNGGEGYYSLITPDEREGKLIGKVGLTVEKANYMGVTFEVEAADEGNREDSSVKYGVRFNYKF